MTESDPPEPRRPGSPDGWCQPPPPSPPPQWTPLAQGGQYPPGGYYGYPRARATNGMAIASMVLGILWIYWIGSVLALVFGYIAKRQIAERGENGAEMATAGIVLGWIGAAIFGLAFLVPILLSLLVATAGLLRS